ncbi:YicC family protein [Ideonella azotifigens]|uniref:YicC family protein n=4 Tax=Ideonella azotifigens TaxID=513160 RepID=A0ABN1JY81_9BURK
MTGFASASASPVSDVETALPGITVEIRTVNSRFLDIAFRLPDELRQLEPAMRELLVAGLRRGKVELRAAQGRAAEEGLPQPSPEQLNRLSRLETSVQAWLPKAPPLSVHEALQWCRSAGSSAPGPARLDELALQAARAAIESLKDARAREGDRLVAILMERIVKLRELAAQAGPLVPAVVQKQQQRFLERWTEALAAADSSTGGNASVSAESARDRALNEAAAFAIRIDVAEELSRLNAHLDEIERLLKAGGELGKRLDFLIQELHREANTLGSKSAALELTGISVEMKVLIEQMREQVQNIE